MSTIKVAMQTQGYLGPNDLERCGRCRRHDVRRHVGFGKRDGDQVHFCTLGGFIVSRVGWCPHFQPVNLDTSDKEATQAAELAAMGMPMVDIASTLNRVAPE